MNKTVEDRRSYNTIIVKYDDNFQMCRNVIFGCARFNCRCLRTPPAEAMTIDLSLLCLDILSGLSVWQVWSLSLNLMVSLRILDCRLGYPPLAREKLVYTNTRLTQASGMWPRE